MTLLKNNIFLIISAVFIVGGCSVAPPANESVSANLTELDQRLQSIERVMRGQGLVNLNRQIAATERRGDEMEGRVEELEYNTKGTAERQRELYIDLDMRIQELESLTKALNLASTSDEESPPLDQLLMPEGSDRDNYQAAFELLKDQQYEPAASAFLQFLAAFPNSELADNAQYWLAESYFATQQFAKALSEFETVISSYLNSRKVPDALLKIGYCYYELKNWDAARTFLTRVQVEYPETTTARLAGQRLQRLDALGD
jgi:tol-pal system protein YbgF